MFLDLHISVGLQLRHEDTICTYIKYIASTGWSCIILKLLELNAYKLILMSALIKETFLKQRF
jgi:hypothetical protein